MGFAGREIRSRIDGDGTLSLSLETVEAGEPGDDEVIVRVEATPINPSDLGLLLGPAELSTLREASDGRPGLTFDIPPGRLAGLEGRLGRSMPVGNEGAGTVVAAGRNAAALEGARVGMIGGGMYADLRRIRAKDVIRLPDGASAADGASMFVNPLTALGFVETARSEGHTAIVHTAAASNLGQMLLRICAADGIPLVNVVRSRQQVELLRGLGAAHVLDSTEDGFDARLVDAVGETGATAVFDATGGGALGGRILAAIERAAVRRMTDYSRYGSDVAKQLYVYGRLDLSPMTLDRAALGFRWGISGWLLTPFLQKAGPEVAEGLRARVARELRTTFASHYTRVIGLADMLRPEVLRAYERKATGEKFLVDPTRG